MNLLFAFQLKLILFYLSSGHPFHVSICEMSYNEESNAFEISYRVFTDDFEEALAEYANKKMDLMREIETDEAKKNINAYLNHHLEIWVKDQKVQLNYLGSEHVDDATWNYFESEKVNMEGQVKVINNVLFEIFKDQMNLVHFEMNGKKSSFRFDRGNPEVVF